jgi:hypothetical protein
MSRNTNLEEILFPVKMCDVFYDGAPYNSTGDPSGEMTGEWRISIPGYRALVNAQTGEPLAVVSKNYRLVTNQEALLLGEQCFRAVFGTVDTSEMEIFNIITPNQKSFCHVDIVHKHYALNIWAQEIWLPFIRLTNSYNRTKALNFALGFCRKLCDNGVIFESKTIEFTFFHMKDMIPEGDFEIGFNHLKELETAFIAQMTSLKSFLVLDSLVLPFVCQALGLEFDLRATDHQKREREHHKFDILKEGIQALTEKYFSQLGKNGYALLNIVSDYASRPFGDPLLRMRISAFQKRTGSWIENFTGAVRASDFNVSTYLGPYLDYSL